jgi:hypothetical protein
MMHILLIVGWFLSLGFFIYLAVEMARDRLSERRAKKATARKFREFRKRHHFDEGQQKWVRNVDGVAVSSMTGSGYYYRRGLSIFGILMLVLWELYWGSEVAEAQNLSQIPHLFLFFVMVGIPLCVYLVSRSMLRHSEN